MSDMSLKPRLADFTSLPTMAEALLASAVLVSIMSGGLALKAFSDIKALRLDLATARGELVVVQDRVAGLEQQVEVASRKQEQQEQLLAARQGQDDRAVEKRGERTAVRLTQEEMQLVRSYIKASPVAPNAAPTMSMGGDLTAATLLPLPAQIVEKLPRLAGARFTVDRNGAIIISLRNSRVADVVIQPH